MFYTHIPKQLTETRKSTPENLNKLGLHNELVPTRVRLATLCICPTFEYPMYSTLSPFQSVVGVVAQFPNYALAVGCV